MTVFPITPTEYEDTVLAAAAFLNEYQMTPVDALYAGIITTGDGRVLSTELDYDTIGLERISLEPDASE